MGEKYNNGIPMIHNPLRRLAAYLGHDIWALDPNRYGSVRRTALRTLRMVVVLWKDLMGGQLTLQAMGLVYTTLLSLVPLLAVSFSVLKAFGVHNQLEPLLLNFLEPLGPEGIELSDRIIAFVENIQVGVLGSVGLAFLIYTAISLIQKIEEAFNYVWHVKRARSFSRRFSDYLSVTVVGPVLVFSAIGATASIMGSEFVQDLLAIQVFGRVFAFVSLMAPSLFIIAAFTFFYVFVPNTRVHLGAALVGGLIAGLLWQGTGTLFASWAASSTRFTAIYTGFAILILFMIWLYLSWLILLLGAQIAYYRQNPEQIRQAGQPLHLSNRLKERVGLGIMVLVGESHLAGRKPWTLEGLVHRLGVPADALEEQLFQLQRLGDVVETADDPAGYVPGRDVYHIRVRDLLAGLRRAEEQAHRLDESRLELVQVTTVFEQLEGAVSTTLGELSLGDLLEGRERG